MFECDRCGSSYSASHIGVEHCPRCHLRDQVRTPLAFKAFHLRESEGTPSLADSSAGDTRFSAAADRDTR